MYDFARRRYEMLMRVREFGASYGHLFPDSSLAHQAFAEVTAGIREIEAQDLAEASATVSARATRKLEARRALVERLILVAKTAQVVSGAGPDFTGHFQAVAPDATNDQLLLTTARRFAKHAAPVAEQFIAHGMAPTFLTDLGALIEGLESALRTRGVSRDEQLAARNRIKTSLKSALAAVRKLDVIVANHPATDSAVREVWKRNRRVDYPAGRSRKDGAPPATPPSEPAEMPIMVRTPDAAA